MSKLRKRCIHHCECKMCRDHPYGSVAQQHQAINRVLATLDEQNRRRFVGLLALQQGDRSMAPLARITGLSRNTIARGKREVEHPTHKRRRRIRTPGAGRPLTEKNSRAFWRPSMNS
jgi:DNA-binding phage protein